MQSKLNSLVSSDYLKGLLNAILVGAGMALLKAFQSPGFSVFTADWAVLLNAAINAAIAAFIVHIGIAFRTDDQGTVNLGAVKIHTK